MLRLLTLILFLTTLPPLSAQRCGDLESWGQRLEAEFPRVNWGSVHEHSAESRRAVLNLYADPLFADAFGSPFERMSERSREAAGRKLGKCQNKLNKLQAGTKSYLQYFALNPFLNPDQAAALTREIPELRNLRIEYQQQLRELKSKDQRLNDLKRLKTTIYRKYGMLWPTEVAQLSALIESKEQGAAAAELLRNARTLNGMECKMEVISLYTDFKSNYADLFALVDQQTATEAEGIVDTKLESCLDELVREEVRALSALSTETDEDLPRLLLLEKKINQDFKGLLTRPDVQGLLAAIRDKKTAQTVRRKEEFTRDISGSTNEKQLRNLIAFLFNLDLSHPDINTLDKLARSRLKLLEQQRLAAQQSAQRAKQEEIRKAQSTIDSKAAAVTAATRRVAALRSSLETKYGTQLPTFTELFYVKAYASAIRGQTDPVDEQRFREYIGDLGYRLSNKGGELFSNRNNFTNSRGYRIKTLRSESGGNTVLLMASFIVKDVPQDILELYLLELTGQSRQRLATSPEVITQIPSGDFDLEGYVLSGGTLYSLQVLNGTMTATARDNSKGTTVVYPEEVAEGTLKVTAFTNSTHLMVKRGERIRFTARGEMKVGFFAGMSTPAGIDGLRMYNLVAGMPHGALLGRIEDGPYFLIGTGKTITADRTGQIKLLVNDKDRSNNEGDYLVNYQRL